MEIRTSTGQVMQEQEFRAYTQANGGPTWDVTTPEVLASLGADIVLEGPQATGGDQYQYSQRDGVEQINGQWFTKYVLGPVFTDRDVGGGNILTAAEQEANYKAQKDEEQAKSVRLIRNSKLSETDWRFRSDMTPSQAWIDYCVALRNVPEQPGFPWAVEWPTEPQ